MATPCVTGTIALMLSKDHELTPEQIDEILESTAIPLSTHKNNDFGSGRIDALAAVNAIGDDGIEEIDRNKIVVYPNPAKDFVIINWSSVEMCHGASHDTSHCGVSTDEYQIINIFGETVSSGEAVSGNQKIDISHLSNGIYFIKIGDSTQKIVVKK